MKRENLAISTPLSTIILASVLLVIVGVASFAANNAINAQLEETQFEQAKNVLLAVDKIVKKVLFARQSSGYVKSSFWKTTPQFTRTGGNLTLIIDAGSVNWTYQIPVNVIKVKGGSHVGVTTPQDILGNGSLLLTDLSSSLGRVSVYQSDGAWVSLDYSRVRCVYTGIWEYFNGSDYESFNVVEITVVNFTFGTIETGTQVFIIVQNLGINSESILDISGNFEIRVIGPDGEEKRSLEELGGDPSKRTIINLVFVNVEVSVARSG
ncbi:MAG: hypothetical protein AYL32_009200 [Candidatus Bathyarchaeota archaeon B26-2]|nr:MAG: hypothetical protein AYL32_009200 [Candidatus Bathyarchaeota archaeon B26-2]